MQLIQIMFLPPNIIIDPSTLVLKLRELNLSAERKFASHAGVASS